LFGSASWVRYNGSANDATSAKGAYCASYIATNKLTAANTSADFSCNPDFSVFQIGGITRWTRQEPDLLGRMMYTRLDQKFTGTAALGPSAPKPATVYEFKARHGDDERSRSAQLLILI